MINDIPQVQFQNEVVRYLFEGVAELVNSETIFLLNDKRTRNLEEGRVKLFEELTEVFGERGAKGIVYRAGECGFSKFIEQFGNDYQLKDENYRFMNQSNRILFGLKQIAAFLQTQAEMDIQVEENPQAWVWKILLTKATSDWESFILGWIKGFLNWSSSGRFYLIESSFTPTSEDVVMMVNIHKQPLGN